MKKRASNWPWAKLVMMTVPEVVEQELAEAKLDLLREEAKLEAAQNWVNTLKQRITRLEGYTK